jgi:hypothetical protein
MQIPQWMFDVETLCAVRQGESPEVNSEALIEIRSLLSAVRKQRAEDVLKARHPSLTNTGVSDAQILEGSAHGANEAVSTDSGATVLDPVTARDSSAGAATAGSTATRAFSSRARAQRIRGERS